ncbi:hemolysin family protein [Actinoplanes utahensis]|uniref:Membrane protein n=1 Tax=Actinoplanes utahensis TaxID=1869 RepID=A0A0A6UGR7_ACTUT|nr:hemolysin family protein [Actinoplanes utahensis]KHD74268.1 membrane protein [Actinoplanes utahensis]GIF31547.1 membrane protein [Actinoplanes utahensis]
MNTVWSLVISLFLLVSNGFFVAAEFALVAAKRHRLETAAAEGSRGARAAMAGTRRLSLMLAGAQLGITLCTLGLGALAKPAIAHLLEPVFTATGLPENAAYVVAFLLSVILVSFLHVVVGEMAPKSWAISHPETSATLLAIPFVGFTTVLKPVLTALNGLANGVLRLARVEPQDELAQMHSAEQLRMLLETSKEHGTIPEAEHQLLTAMLGVESRTVREVMVPTGSIVTVAASDDARTVELRSTEAGRSRMAVTDAGGGIAGIVHVREAAKAVGSGSGATAGTLMADALRLPAGTTVLDAVASMRHGRNQVALVTEDGRVVGLVALEDLLEQVIGQFDDETDPVIDAARRAGRRSRSHA